jgi:hypothetical protein
MLADAVALPAPDFEGLAARVGRFLARAAFLREPAAAVAAARGPALRAGLDFRDVAMCSAVHRIPWDARDTSPVQVTMSV